MAEGRYRYRNPEAPPGMKRPVYGPSIPPKNPDASTGMKMPVVCRNIPPEERNPDAPPGMYKFEDEPNNTKVYFPLYGMVIDLSVLLEDDDLTAENTDFEVERSEEGDFELQHLTSKKNEKVMKKRTKTESSDYSTGSSYYAAKKKKYKRKKRKRTRSRSCSESRCRRSRSESRRRRYHSESCRSRSHSESHRRRSRSESHRRRYHSESCRSRSRSESRRRRYHSESCRSRSHSESRCSRSYSVSRRSMSHMSASCLDSEEDKKNCIKLEDIKPPEHLYGSYMCEVCNIKLTSQQSYESHISGKRHMKVLRSKNLANTVLRTVPRTDAESKYPQPPSGIRRVSSREKANIQDLLEKQLEMPCPALHKVIEIRGLTETKYYCILCDSRCDGNCIISHLNGYKHRLRCLKYFLPEVYQRHNYEDKYKFEHELNRILKSIQKVEGMGKISVEKEISIDEYSSHSGRRDIYQPSTSSLNDPRSSSISVFDESSVRDYSKSGFYCKICQSHMNSLGMWESHLSGKRHLANMKKNPGSIPSKIRSIPMPSRPSMLVRMLKDEVEPIVGLDHVVEIQNPETNLPRFHCFLCNASLTRVDIRDHLVSEKHRKNYLQEIKNEEFALIDSMHIRDLHTRNLIVEICARIEEKFGRSRPEVRVAKDTLNL